MPTPDFSNPDWSKKPTGPGTYTWSDGAWRGGPTPAEQAAYAKVLKQRAAAERNKKLIKIGTVATAALMTGGAAGAFSGGAPAAGAGAGGSSLAPIAGGAPWAVTPLASTAGMAAPSYAALASTAAATAPAVTGGGSLAPIAGGAPWPVTPYAGTAAMSTPGAVAGGTMPATTEISKTMIGVSTAAGFLRDYLNNKNIKKSAEQERQAALALLQLQQAHDAEMTRLKLAADKDAHDKDLADRQAGRDAELAMIDPYARTRSQTDTMVQLDKLGQKKAFNYDISGLPFGSMMPHNRGTIGYEPSAELKAWAATRGGQVRSGLPGATPGAASGPPTSNTMPVAGAGGRVSTTMPTMPEPSFVGDDLIDAPVSNVPLDSNELRMSIERLMRDSATSRPMARRRRTPMALPMR